MVSLEDIKGTKIKEYKSRILLIDHLDEHLPVRIAHSAVMI